MSNKHRMAPRTLCLVVLGLVATVPVFAGSAVVGSVSGSMNATVGGQTLLPNATLFSGDSLQVKDGLAVVSLGSAGHMVFGRNTVASFLRDSNEVTVLLGQGNVSVFHDANGMPVCMKIGDLSVVPVSGFKTLGEVAMLNGAVVVTAKEGMLRVEGNGPPVNVAKGKTLTVVPRTSAPPQAGGAGGVGGAGAGGAFPVMTVLTAAVASGSLVMGGVELSRVDTALNNAASAASAAAGASSGAAAAVSAAEAALSAANAAGSTSAAELNQVGCALDTLAGEQGQASPYSPPKGETCPPSS